VACCDKQVYSCYDLAEYDGEEFNTIESSCKWCKEDEPDREVHSYGLENTVCRCYDCAEFGILHAAPEFSIYGIVLALIIIVGAVIVVVKKQK